MVVHFNHLNITYDHKLVILCLFLLVIPGCGSISKLLEGIEHKMDRYAREENENFNIITVDFYSQAREDEWFRDSQVAEQLNQAIIDGVRLAKKENSRIKMVDQIDDLNVSLFYQFLRDKRDSERRIYLHELLAEYDANFIIFGQFDGDDYKIEVMPFTYSSTRNAIGKGYEEIYFREDAKTEIYDKIAIQINNMLTNVLSKKRN